MGNLQNDNETFICTTFTISVEEFLKLKELGIPICFWDHDEGYYDAKGEFIPSVNK